MLRGDLEEESITWPGPAAHPARRGHQSVLIGFDLGEQHGRLVASPLADVQRVHPHGHALLVATGPARIPRLPRDFATVASVALEILRRDEDSAEEALTAPVNGTLPGWPGRMPLSYVGLGYSHLPLGIINGEATLARKGTVVLGGRRDLWWNQMQCFCGISRFLFNGEIHFERRRIKINKEIFVGRVEIE